MAKPESEAKKDFRQELTDKFVAALEQGKLPWQRPWNDRAVPLSTPINAISEKPYQGGNRLVLTLTQMDKSYEDPRWVTFNQAKALGGSVAKGEKGTQIEFWREKPFYQRRDIDVKLGASTVKVVGEKDGQVTLEGGRTAPAAAFVIHYDGKKYGWGQAERKLNTLVGQTHTIFNVGQCRDLQVEPLAPTPESKMPMHERGELLLEGMKKDGVRFIEAPNRAFYRSASDTISLPPRDDFKSEAMYYGTALHESAHATGNEKRLSRDVGKNDFGSEGYAKEELVAEMTSAFLAAETGIPHDMEGHTAYIQSWAEALKNDKNELFRAAKLADQAANYMHDRAREVQLERSQIKEQRQEVSKTVASSIDHPPLPGERSDLSHIFSALPSPGQPVDVDAQLAKDHAAMEAGTRARISGYVMQRADRELASGEIDQDVYDQLAATHASPVLSGMDGLSSTEVMMGSYKPSPDSRVYVERGFLTIDHQDRKISFASAKSLEESATEYGLSNKDLLTADAVELRQSEAKEIEMTEAKQRDAQVDEIEQEEELSR